MSWGEKVEAPEDMDETSYDIDPRMMIWKSMKGSGQDKQHLKAEEDLDELYHPSMPDLLKVQIQNVGAPPAADGQREPLQEDTSVKYYQKPEEDRDDIDHPVFSKMASEEPKQDQDEIYSKAMKELNEHQLGLEARGEGKVRLHLQPEEDRDHLYHKDVPLRTPYQGDTEAAAAVEAPFQRVYSEPEEDLDHLYHQ